MVGIRSDMMFHYIRTKEMVCQLLGWSGGPNVTPIQVYLVSGGILRCWLSTLVVVASHVLLCLCQCSHGLRVHPVHEFIDCFQAGCKLCRFEPHARMSTGVQVERCLLGSRVCMIVVLELC